MADTDPTTSTAGSTPTAVCTVRAVRAARPWGGALSDLVLDGGTVAAASPHDPSTLAGPDDVDGASRLALPAFTDAHVHLDSTRVGRPSKPHTAEPHTAEPGPLWNLVANDRDRPSATRPTSCCCPATPRPQR